MFLKIAEWVHMNGSVVNITGFEEKKVMYINKGRQQGMKGGW